MESVSIATLWPVFAIMGTILVAAVGGTTWIVGRMSGKVDWKVYQQRMDALQGTIAGLRTDVSTLLERSEGQGKFIEYFMKNKFTSQTGGQK